MKRKRAAREKPRTNYSWLLIPAAVFIAYLPALNGGILWDDLGHITVPELRSVHGLWRIWSEIGATQQYYPLLHSAFWLEHRLWGDAWPGYHLMNVVLHGTAAFLLVRILRQLAIPGALFAGLIFAVHPVAVESVAWISEQKNTLSAVFYLTSALVYLRFNIGGSKEQDPPYVRTRQYWLAFGFFICALLTKTVTATLPAALLLMLWWQRGSITWRRDVVPLLPWFAAATAGGLLTIWFEREGIGASGADFTLTFVERVLLAGRIIWFYLAKLFWPHNLIFIYPRWNVDAAAWWQYLFPLGAVALAIALWIAARGKRGPLAGYLFFCGTLVPVLGFVNVFPFLFSYVADHFQYLATLGIIVPVAASLSVASERAGPSRQRLLRGLGGAVIVVLVALTWNRSAVYRDAETLYRDTVARNPGAWMAHLNLGTELANRGRLSEAIEAYEGALRARPDYPVAKNNLVLAHMRVGDAFSAAAGRSNDAIAHYEAVLRIEPEHFRAHYNLGTLLMDIPQRQGDAIAHLEAAVALEPASVEARVNLGMVLAEIPARRREAIAHLEFALSKRPDLVAVGEALAALRSGPG